MEQSLVKNGKLRWNCIEQKIPFKCDRELGVKKLTEKKTVICFESSFRGNVSTLPLVLFFLSKVHFSKLRLERKGVFQLLPDLFAIIISLFFRAFNFPKADSVYVFSSVIGFAFYWRCLNGIPTRSRIIGL